VGWVLSVGDGRTNANATTTAAAAASRLGCAGGEFLLQGRVGGADLAAGPACRVHREIAITFHVEQSSRVGCGRRTIRYRVNLETRSNRYDTAVCVSAAAHAIA
jgi:hypothetical protein